MSHRLQRGIRPWIGRAAIVLLCALSARGQSPSSSDGMEEPQVLSPAAEKLKALTDPEKVKKRAEERSRPPYEFFRTQVAPFDVLPYAKEGHWLTLSLELRANYEDFTGLLQTGSVRLLDMPHAVSFRREARLLKEQQARLPLQVLMPSFLKELPLELTRLGAIRPDGVTPALFRKLEPHQHVLPVVGENALAYAAITRFQALIPTSADRDPNAVEKQRYYRVLHSADVEKPLPFSTNPLTWTTISHLIWDDFNPEELNVGQQQALVDWLHWGGQLIVVGGAGPSLAPLRESFLAPYLPAIPDGRDALLSSDDLLTLSRSHPAPYWPEEGESGVVPRYLPDGEDNRIRLAPGKQLFLTGLEPVPGSTVLPLGDSARHVLGVEWRVGRGRVLMLGLKLTEKPLLDWPGFDTFLRRVVLRRPLETANPGGRLQVLPATATTWQRYAGRDLGAPVPREKPPEPGAAASFELALPTDSVCAWLDAADLPRMTRTALQEASGITIPGSKFVLRVILLYMLALVPLNWLICRFVLRRRELAWVVTPLVALGFAIVVERGAAYDLGFDTACDEVDLLELQGEHPRGHLSRFAALYSTGRHSFSVAFPDDPSAVALPMNMANNLVGGDTLQSVWQSYPEASLTEFPVQPRALAMYRAEQMVNLPGGLSMVADGGQRRILNGTGLELRDAAVVDVAGRVQYRLGTIPPGGSAVLNAAGPLLGAAVEEDAAEESKTEEEPPAGPGTNLAQRATTRSGERWTDPEPFLHRLRDYNWRRPEDQREWRLVAWTPGPHPGQSLRPAVDRHRGLRLVLAHLDYGGTPQFDVNRGEEAIVPYLAIDRATTPETSDDPPATKTEADRP